MGLEIESGGVREMIGMYGRSRVQRRQSAGVRRSRLYREWRCYRSGVGGGV